MRLSRLLLVIWLLAFAAAAGLHAQSIGSPYSVVVPVADTGEVQRDEAFAQALGQVLARVAGGQDLRSNDGYAEALKGATAIVQKFQYQRVGSGLALNVDFEPGAVRRLVGRLGVASAGVKPPVLLLVEGRDGELLDKSELGPLVAPALARGTYVAYPDAASPPVVARLAAAEPAALAEVNQRYRTGLVLLGKLKDGAADWTLVSGGQVQQWSNNGATEDALLEDAGTSMVDRLGKQLNVVGATVTKGKLWVSGLKTGMDYASLLATLRADPAIQEVTTLSVQGDAVMLAVKAVQPMSGLAANLAAGGRLLQQQESQPGADANLRWLH